MVGNGTAAAGRLSVEALGGALGAVVSGVEVSEIAETADALRAAWAEHLVLVFPQVGWTAEQQLRLAKALAPRVSTPRGVKPGADADLGAVQLQDTAGGYRPEAASVWHADNTFMPEPAIGSLLCMVEPSPTGGDTMWANLQVAYETLDESVRSMIDGRRARHGKPPRTPVALHPMVRRHRVTERRGLFVNREWTHAIDGLDAAASAALLSQLFDWCERPEHVMRWSWSPGDAVLWDNLATIHVAIHDYGQARRIARRVSLFGPPTG